MATHYEVLEIEPGAAPERVRLAYHDQARVWHPDRYSSADGPRADEAEVRMRRINEAWRVLSDPVTRKAYDASLVAPVVRVARREPTRIDPHLLDPELLRARARAAERTVEERQKAVVRVAPFVALVVLLIAVLVLASNVRGDSSDRVETTVPGPAVPFEPGACIRVLSEGVIEVPGCDGIYQGRLIGVRTSEGECVERTVSEVGYQDLVLCLQ